MVTISSLQRAYNDGTLEEWSSEDLESSKAIISREIKSLNSMEGFSEQDYLLKYFDAMETKVYQTLAWR